MRSVSERQEDKSRGVWLRQERGERLAGGGEPRFGGRRDLCYLVNHRVVGVAYHFGCHVGGFFLVAGFYIDGVAVAVEVDYFHLVFFHAVGARGGACCEAHYMCHCRKILIVITVRRGAFDFYVQ